MERERSQQQSKGQSVSKQVKGQKAAAAAAVMKANREGMMAVMVKKGQQQ